MGKLFHTDQSDKGSTLIRITLGLVMFPHGAQKLLGWFGGHGYTNTMAYFTDHMGIPAILAFLVIIAESFGALALVAGLLTRVSAAGIAAVMTVAATVHATNGFFMNWDGSQAGEGYEYHLLALGMAVVLIIRGGGALSLDSILRQRLV